jgi:toxin YoeB
MLIAWSGRAWEACVAWQEEDRAVARRITRLIGAIRRDPFRGEGKPAPLRGVVTAGGHAASPPSTGSSAA